MSKQSDMETLYYFSVDAYAKLHHFTREFVWSLFERNHVFEHMLSQHEYLHQVAFECCLDYIEEIVNRDNIMLQLYHGTTSLFDNIDLNLSNDRRDFGKGFYTTVIEKQAFDWAKRLSQRRASPAYYVNLYEYKEDVSLKILRFLKVDKDWLTFIKDNRIQGGCHHEYDVVIGPVADDNTMHTIALYVSGAISINAAMEELRYSLVNNQISFHSERALNCLRLLGRKNYEI